MTGKARMPSSPRETMDIDGGFGDRGERGGISMQRYLVIGAGPSGVAASCILADSGAAVTLVDQSDGIGGACRFYGGHLAKFMKWDLPGEQLQRVLGRGIWERIGAGRLTLKLGTKVEGLQFQEGGVLWQGERYEGVVFAVGARPRARHLHCPGEGVLVGAGHRLECTPVMGRRVAVLGGGDNAMENACRMAYAGARVSVFSRSIPHGLRKSASESSRALFEAAIEAGVHMVYPFDYVLEGRSVRYQGTVERFDKVSVLYGYAARDDLWGHLAHRQKLGGGVLQVGDRMLVIGDACRGDGERSLDLAWQDGLSVVRHLALKSKRTDCPPSRRSARR